MTESFRPIANTAPGGFMNTLKFHFRFIFDLQNLSIYLSLVPFFKNTKGKVLDVGCGDSPYMHLLNKESVYIGVDIRSQDDFDYNNRAIIYFKEDKIPLESDSVDAVICTEVLEHVSNPEQLIEEIRRVLKKDGEGLITVPWSARYHYIPHDYYRYTPAGLEKLFKMFSYSNIQNRGTDITSICSKLIVLCARHLIPSGILNILLLPVSIFVGLPVLVSVILIGQLSLLTGIGSKDDPLGYTVHIRK